jgi:hypothetical protein
MAKNGTIRYVSDYHISSHFIGGDHSMCSPGVSIGLVGVQLKSRGVISEFRLSTSLNQISAFMGVVRTSLVAPAIDTCPRGISDEHCGRRW